MAFIDFMGQLNCIAKNSFQIENLLWQHLSTKRIMVVGKKADKDCGQRDSNCCPLYSGNADP